MAVWGKVEMYLYYLNSICKLVLFINDTNFVVINDFSKKMCSADGT